MIERGREDDEYYDDEDKNAQSFVNDLQSQIKQTKVTVDSIQDKLILIKENENEIKSMLVRLLREKGRILL